jgi:hypothetical protein
LIKIAPRYDALADRRAGPTTSQIRRPLGLTLSEPAVLGLRPTRSTRGCGRLAVTQAGPRASSSHASASPMPRGTSAGAGLSKRPTPRLCGG